MVQNYNISKVRKIVLDTLSGLPINKNKENTQNYTYKTGIMTEINDTKESPEGIFP